MWTLRLVRAAGVFKRESRTLWLSSGHHSWWQPYCNGKSHGSLQQNGNSKERWKSGSRGGRARYGVGGLLAATVVRPDGQDEIDGSVDHFEVVDGLVRETLTCATCRLRLPVDRKIDGTPYCSCPKGGRAPAADVAGWKPFIERPGTLVWRRQHHTLKGLFAYKMYGRLDEITALDFLRVQLDTTYRRRWDPSAAQLEVVDEDEESATDIVYWETHWPKPFSNRDYVFERRIDVDAERRLCVLSSAATNHAARPARRSMHRVTEYWSHMVVRPLGDWNQPGVEFVLTYFDNPGLSIPSSVSTWVAMTALPDFVVKLNEAALHVGERGGSQPALMKRVHAELEQWRQLQLEQQREQSLLESVGEQVSEPALGLEDELESISSGVSLNRGSDLLQIEAAPSSPPTEGANRLEAAPEFGRTVESGTELQSVALMETESALPRPDSAGRLDATTGVLLEAPANQTETAQKAHPIRAPPRAAWPPEALRRWRPHHDPPPDLEPGYCGLLLPDGTESTSA